jgi:hypothetical protein
MRVKIGPYNKWIGPYQIAEMLLFWKDSNDDQVDKLGAWLAKTSLGTICQWVENKKSRKVKVHIDEYDTWNMDHTLSLIIVPMLHDIRQNKHGAPYTDNNDVPEELRSTSTLPNGGDTDENHFKRWDWIVNEMIFAFEHIKDDKWEDECWSGEADFYLKKLENSSNLSLETGPKHTLTCDREKFDAINARIDNGLRLFGKYYRSLWT